MAATQVLVEDGLPVEGVWSEEGDYFVLSFEKLSSAATIVTNSAVDVEDTDASATCHVEVSAPSIKAFPLRGADLAAVELDDDSGGEAVGVPAAATQASQRVKGVDKFAAKMKAAKSKFVRMLTACIHPTSVAM